MFGAFVILIGLLVLAACGQAANSGQDDAARKQFLSERGGGTPQAGQGVTNTVGSGAGGGPQMFFGPDGAGGAFGTVESVDSANGTITVKNPMDSTTTKVHLASGGKVYRQVDAQASDLTVGANIVAVGTQDGDTLNVDMVQIGVDLMGGSRTVDRPVMSFNNGVAPGSTPAQGDFMAPKGVEPGGQGTTNNVAPPPSVSGTVEKVDGDTLTVKTQDGKTATVQATSTTRLQKQTEGDLSTLKQGETVAATGEKKDDTFEATRIQVMQMMR